VNITKKRKRTKNRLTEGKGMYYNEQAAQEKIRETNLKKGIKVVD